MNAPIDISPADLETVREILAEHVPEHEVWAFGSRVAWTARQYSDLDLAVMTTEPLDIIRIADLKESFAESDLPFRVDIVDWADASENFRKIIKRRHALLATGNNEKPSEKKHSGEANKYPSCLLGKVVANFDSQRIPLSSQERKRCSGSYPYYGATGIMDYVDDFLFEGLHLLVAEDGSVEKPDGKPFLQLVNGKFWVNNHAHVLKGSTDEDTKYIYYALSTVAVRPFISGSVQAKLSQRNMNRISIPFPVDKSDRYAISHVLGTLDEKIELNRTVSETLEAMAQALFKSWFIDFDPVRAKMEGRWRQGESLPGLPAHFWDFFPNRMVKSEMGKTPEGWTTGNIADIAVSPRRGVSPTDLREETPYIGLEHMPRQSVALMEWGKAKSVTSNKSIFDKGNILFGKLRPYFHKVGIAPIDGICSTDILVIVPKATEWSSFLLACVSSNEFIKYADQTSTGTKMPRTSWNIIGKYQVCLPTVAVAQTFHNVVNVFLNRIVANIHESHSLIALRNVLLPKLVSGKLNVINF